MNLVHQRVKYIHLELFLKVSSGIEPLVHLKTE